MIEECVRSEMFTAGYADIFAGDRRWQSLPTPVGDTFDWGPSSTYIRNPPDFERISLQPQPVVDIVGARVLAMLGDSVTTDHISPVGAIKPDSPAGRYLHDHGVSPAELNSYPTARGEATTR